MVGPFAKTEFLRVVGIGCLSCSTEVSAFASLLLSGPMCL